MRIQLVRPVAAPTSIAATVIVGAALLLALLSAAQGQQGLDNSYVSPIGFDYSFSLVRADRTLTQLPSVLSEAKVKRVDEIAGESASVRLRANDAQALVLTVHHRMDSPILLDWPAAKLACMAVGSMAHLASVRPAGSQADPASPSSSLPGITVAAEVGYRSLFGALPVGAAGAQGTQPAGWQVIAQRISQPNTMLFVVPTFFGDADPVVVQVYRLDVRKHHREWIWGKSKSIDYNEGIPFKVVRYLPHSGADFVQAIRIEPKSPLPAGEYAFVTLETDDWFSHAFGAGVFADHQVLYRGSKHTGAPAKWRFHCFGIDR